MYGNGNKYEGQFVEGNRHGRGKLEKTNGDVYIGFFREDIMEGLGIYKWASGNRYEGEFKNNKPNGRGSLVSHEGKKINGLFKDGKLEKTLTDSKHLK